MTVHLGTRLFRSALRTFDYNMYEPKLHGRYLHKAKTIRFLLSTDFSICQTECSVSVIELLDLTQLKKGVLVAETEKFHR